MNGFPHKSPYEYLWLMNDTHFVQCDINFPIVWRKVLLYNVYKIIPFSHADD